ncbi:MAG TPA: oxidoreductase [Gammaproteobacteria bacterium]|nr:MAG: SDR family oxidoreductase [OM182 bacterium]HAL41198.1 oxidoreductase [Gammaproteobacteria bacterium]HBK19440.1 oxidoreductase [Gammaproteobacteria bacterium]|tara:strand:+ start:54 stop:818 length:765 start_codon:yes stop_codon:yes gene_type:complete
MSRLDAKVAIITGGAGGIGIAAARRFIAEGAEVLLVDIDEEALIEVCEGIGSNRLSYTVADVASVEDNRRMVEVAEQRYGGVDILLANAGILGDTETIEHYDVARLDQVLAVNIKGPFLGLQAVIPAMRRRKGGSVVITSSIVGVKGAARLAPYVTSKHAVMGLMRSAARELAGDGIRVNTVNPSQTETRMMRSLEQGMNPDDPQRAQALMTANIPLQRYGQPEDVASVMLFLASDDASFITGSSYMADGGSSA